MTLETAKQVHALLMVASRSLEESVAVVEKEGPEGELRAYRRGVGRVLATIMDELLLPTYREHNELIPPELDRSVLPL